MEQRKFCIAQEIGLSDSLIEALKTDNVESISEDELKTARQMICAQLNRYNSVEQHHLWELVRGLERRFCDHGRSTSGTCDVCDDISECLQTYEDVCKELEAIEQRLAIRFGIEKNIRQTLIELDCANLLEEGELVADWHEYYSAFKNWKRY